MNVGELIDAIEIFLKEDRRGRALSRIYINDGYDIDDYTIDSVYYRCGEVVLQSNETDNGNWALIAPYVLHCLKFFKRSTNVCIQVSDEDLDWEYYDTCGCYINDNNQFVISCQCR
jgi:hypothetical protein